MKQIFYHMKEPAVHVLGPGTRFVLWVQGCHKNCPGCVAAGTHKMSEGKTIETGALAWEIALSGADGITLSGGEPFLQAEALAELLHMVHSIRPMGVICFTGYRYEELDQMPGAKELLAQIDLLIDGEYIQELDDHRGLRGSSNQRMIPLTDLYRAQAPGFSAIKREQEIYYHGIELHEVGIPTANGMYFNENTQINETNRKE